MNSGEGNDYIYNKSNKTTIISGDGNDIIYNEGYNITISNIIIDAGAGDDSIKNWYGDYVSINSGEGNNTIENYNGNNATITGGKDNDTIINLDSNNVTIFAGIGNDCIDNNGNNVIIIAEEGDDSIYNSGNSVTIDSGEGNHYIYNYGGSNVTIKGGTGNDYIVNEYYSNNVTINAGNGDDIISISSYNKYNLIQYANGDGNDTIDGLNADDTLQITGGTYSTLKSGNDILVEVGEGSILVKDATNISFNIDGTFESASGENIFNENDSTLISGTDEDDTIFNSGNTVQILAQGGNDSIYNSGENVSISGGNDNDTIENAGNNVSIDSGDGKNNISNAGIFVTINGGADNDTISNSGNNVLINGNGGNNSISNDEGSNVTINGGYSDDFISNSGTNFLINGDYGNDTLTNNGGNNITLNGGYGNDVINSNGDSKVTINGGDGDDVINISNGKNLIQYNAGNGNDTIFGITENDTLKIIGANYAAVRSGNDIRIIVGDNSVLIKDAANTKFNIDGTQEGNAIPNGWKFASSIATASISSAEHLDLTENYGAGIVKVNGTKLTKDTSIIGNELDNSIKGGTGSDTIDGSEGNDTLTGGKGDDIFIYSGGEDLITDYGTGADTIKFDIDNTENISVEADGTNLIYKTSAGNLTVKNGNGKDIKLIDSVGKNISLEIEQTLYIEGTSGADNISNSLDNATINALGGNDKIYNEGSNVTINAGAGNDKINIDEGAENITIYGGAGNDTIYNEGNGNLYQYATGDGKDVIVGYNENDTLHITNGVYSYSISGNDFIVKVGSNTIKLKDAADKNILIKNASGNIETVIPEVLPNGWKYGTSSKTSTDRKIFTASISSAEKEIDLTEEYGDGVLKVDGSKVSDATIIGNAENNSIKAGGGNDELDGGEGDDTLTGGKGDDIFIYSGGNDFITDYGTGADSIQIDTNNIELLNYEEKNSDVIYTTNEGTLTVKNAIKGGVLKNIILMDEGYNVIDYPDKVKIPTGWQFDSAKNLLKATMAGADNEIDLAESYGENVEKVDGSKISGGVEIYANDLNNSLKGGKGNDVLDGGTGNDTLTGGSGDDVFIYSGGDDYITDYTAGKDSIQIDINEIEITGVDTVGYNVVYTTDEGTLTVAKGSGKDIILMDMNGERIIINGVVIPSGWQLDTVKHILKATLPGADNEIDLSEGYGDGIEKVDGSKISGGVEIYANNLNNSLKGGKGNDVLDGGAGNDTLTGGSGDDVFIYSGGDDFITDYTAGKDSIQIDINEIEITGVETLNSNVIYYTDAGNLTVKNGKGKDITLMDADENIIEIGAKFPDGWKYNDAKKLLQATVAGAENYIDLTEEYGEGVEKVDASKISGVEIYGNDLDNSIKGGKGNDILDGGAGNDTLTGGAGADTYVYSGGDDFITDYATVDAVQFDTTNIAITNVETISSNVVVTTEQGTLTIKNAKTKKISFIDENGEKFTYSNKNVAEDILFMDDNYISDELQIDSVTEITPDNYSVQNIETQNYSNLTQEQNILTFTDDK